MNILTITCYFHREFVAIPYAARSTYCVYYNALYCMYNTNAGTPCTCMLPYFGKRKQVTKVKFLVKEQNVSVIYTDVNGIS